jgi:hypothetical protein
MKICQCMGGEPSLDFFFFVSSFTATVCISPSRFLSLFLCFYYPLLWDPTGRETNFPTLISYRLNRSPPSLHEDQSCLTSSRAISSQDFLPFVRSMHDWQHKDYALALVAHRHLCMRGAMNQWAVLFCASAIFFFFFCESPQYSFGAWFGSECTACIH